jgi:hypothetical protein
MSCGDTTGGVGEGVEAIKEIATIMAIMGPNYN